MNIIKSVCTPSFFPKSRYSLYEFERMAHFLAEKGIECAEYCYDGDGRDKIGAILQNTKLSGVSIAIAELKEKELHLCSVDDDNRNKAIAFVKAYMDESMANNVSHVMINSGKSLANPHVEMEKLKLSLCEIYEYSLKKNYALHLSMEPCDSNISVFHLVGPVAKVKEIATSVRKLGVPLNITLDSAHVAEEGEDFMSTLKAIKQFCNHVHFANCYIKDKNSPLYGDKHVAFDYPDAEWSFEKYNNLLTDLSKMYSRQTLQIALEALCRTDDPYKYFVETWAKLPMLH